MDNFLVCCPLRSKQDSWNQDRCSNPKLFQLWQPVWYMKLRPVWPLGPRFQRVGCASENCRNCGNLEHCEPKGTVGPFKLQWTLDWSTFSSNVMLVFWTVFDRIGHSAQQNDRNVESVYPSGLSQIPVTYSSSVVCYFAYLLVSGVSSLKYRIYLHTYWHIVF